MLLEAVDDHRGVWVIGHLGQGEGVGDRIAGEPPKAIIVVRFDAAPVEYRRLHG